LSAEQACLTNRSSIWSIEAPHVYYMNLDKSIATAFAMKQQLEHYGYNYTRIRAVTPKDMRLRFSNETIEKKTANCKASTTSHLQSIYTAVRDYELNTLNHKRRVHYVLILEDDCQFLFDIDWKGLVESVPVNWSILQLTVHNTDTLKAYFKEWKKFNKLWVKRTRPDAYSIGAYLVNMDSPRIRELFGNPTNDEKTSINIRLNEKKLFSKCNHSDLSMPSRISCQAFGDRSSKFERLKSRDFKCNHSDSSMQSILDCKALEKKVRRYEEGFQIPPDHFVYHLGDPHTYTSTVPYFGFKIGVPSPVSNLTRGVQNKGFKMILSCAQEAVKNSRLPSFLSKTLCSYPIMKVAIDPLIMNSTSSVNKKMIMASNLMTHLLGLEQFPPVHMSGNFLLGLTEISHYRLIFYILMCIILLQWVKSVIWARFNTTKNC
jgi:hypothetical protein